MSEKKCGGCEHFKQVAGYGYGLCYGMPPTVFYQGGQSEEPHVKPTRPSCHLFSALLEGQAAAIKTKIDPETPRDAAKAAKHRK